MSETYPEADFQKIAPVRQSGETQLDPTDVPCTWTVKKAGGDERFLVSPTFDLNSYLVRIGYHGARTPAFATLAAVHAAHAQRIPFENLNPLLKLPVPLDVESLQRKLVFDGRGGYCFEQNLLLQHALEELGFTVTRLTARVLWNMGEDALTPRCHMLLLVHVDRERYIADVGFGGLTLTTPLRLETDIEQTTTHEPFRFHRKGDMFIMQANVGDTWKPLYRFDLQEQLLVDYEVMNWYASSHPNSRFVSGLIAARPDTDCRYALTNTELATYHRNGSIKKRKLASAGALRETLEKTFQLTLPTASEIDIALERIVSQFQSKESES